jgi:hypothetical protein
MATNQNKNPLEELLLDENQNLDLSRLAQVLKPFTRIDKSSHAIQFLQPFYEQKNENKILILLATSKARKELLGDEEKMSQSDIISLEIMPEGSVKATLKKLYDGKNIKAEKSKYYLPNYQIDALLTQLNK